METKLVKHMRIAPLQQQFFLARREPCRTAAPQIECIRRGAKMVECHHAGGGQHIDAQIRGGPGQRKEMLEAHRLGRRQCKGFPLCAKQVERAAQRRHRLVRGKAERRFQGRMKPVAAGRQGLLTETGRIEPIDGRLIAPGAVKDTPPKPRGTKFAPWAR